MIIVADQTLPLLHELFEPLGELRLFSGRRPPKPLLHGATALLVRSTTPVDRTLLEASSIRWVGTASAGYNHLQTDQLAELRVEWSRAPGCNAAAVADHTMVLVADALQRKVLSRGDGVAVVGVGEVGSRVAARLPAFGLKPLLYDPPRAALENNPALAKIEQLYTAKMVTFHLPLIHTGAWKTADLIDDNWLRPFKELQLLFNSSRGEVVTEEALFNAVKNGVEVSLDVWRNEPEINLALLQQVRWATPHIAGHSRMGKLRAVILLRQAFDRWRGVDSTIDEKQWREELPLSRCSGDSLLGLVESVSWLERDDRSFRKALFSGDLQSTGEVFDWLRNSYPTRTEFSEITLSGIQQPVLRTTHQMAGFTLST